MIRLLTKSLAPYTVRLAKNAADLEAAQRLRYRVFNLEMGEGLEESHRTGRDEDPFDAVCDHLLVTHVGTQEVVGTYRLQTGAAAAANLGYYSEQEFDFAPFEPIRHQMIETGRACVHHDHRNLVVLGMLWKGIGDYALAKGARYLCGCSSLTSQDPAEGAAAYEVLAKAHLAPPERCTKPTPEYDCPMDQVAVVPPKVPKLLRAYLALGAKICGPPALDRHFKTIDFLTLLDMDNLSEADRNRFLG
jgi:putative hemolysin